MAHLWPAPPDETLTHSEVNGAKRWDLTLKRGSLRVSHLDQAVNVEKYHGAPLLIDEPRESRIAPASTTPDDSYATVEGIAREIRMFTRSRSRKLREIVLRQSRGVCEACGTDYSGIAGGLGVHALQVHHRRQLALQDKPVSMSVSDLAVVCANCHMMIHANRQTAIPVEKLRSLLDEEKERAGSRCQPSLRGLASAYESVR